MVCCVATGTESCIVMHNLSTWAGALSPVAEDGEMELGTPWGCVWRTDVLKGFCCKSGSDTIDICRLIGEPTGVLAVFGSENPALPPSDSGFSLLHASCSQRFVFEFIPRYAE